MSKWTEERVEYAKKRWVEGGSGAEIASEIGDGFTKNSIICKMHRLGLSFQGGSRDGRSAGQPRTPRASKPAISVKARSAVKAQARSVERMFKDRPATVSKASSILYDRSPLPTPEMPDTEFFGAEAVRALTDNACKWPVGDPLTPSFRFCGCERSGTYAYCAYHARMAYRTSDKRVIPVPVENVIDDALQRMAG